MSDETPQAAGEGATVRLDDKYTRRSGRILLSGTQALIRLPLMQRARDAAASLNTAGYISGYRGSPLGGYDQQLSQERERLIAAYIRFEPGVNEDLAATAIWGTQQVTLLPGARVDGVFAIWYGKGPGVDRAGDPFKHGNRMGTSRHGGVLVVFGDDHAGKSSTVAHQSEMALAANGIPVLYPATVQEYLDLGLHGFALSRYSGVWVGFKCVNDTVETTASCEVDPLQPEIRMPPPPAESVHARHAFEPLADDTRLQRLKLPLVHDYVRRNALDRIVHPSMLRNLGIVSAGKSWLDVEEALVALGLRETRLRDFGVSVYKPALIWPLEPQGIRQFARGQRELLFVEEKVAFLETQSAQILYGLPDGERPRISGKVSADGEPLFASDVPLEPLRIALIIGTRLQSLNVGDAALHDRIASIRNGLAQVEAVTAPPLARTPYFCSGCPHNTSTKVPDGSLAMAGIGCHTMVLFMDRHTLPPTQMGGEGANWSGIAPFTQISHVFQNIGDGTYFHSGLLAIRAAVNSGVNITYKILLNDAVAMTGGQPVEGGLSAAEISQQLRAERVKRIVVVSDDTDKYADKAGFADGVTFHDRSELDRVQRELREVAGVSALIYEQTCAAEKRRRRKRGTYPDPARRVFINQQVCEGCGDCSVQSNCVAVEPLETPLGRKRQIDQSSCNKDFSCLNGFCPSFVTVEGAQPRKKSQSQELTSPLLALLPEPARAACEEPVCVLITGIGGTGVVTIGAVLGMAAHLDGLAVSAFDMTGLAQKGGAVLSHVKIARRTDAIAAPRIGLLEADLVLGCDLVVTAGAEVQRAIAPGRTQVLLNTHLVPTAGFQANPDVDFHAPELRAQIEALTTSACLHSIDAAQVARSQLGDSIGTNMMMVGFALQRGLLPVSLAAVRQAITLNGTAVNFNLRALDLGRLLALPAGQSGLEEAAAAAPAAAESLDSIVESRAPLLVLYQNAGYASRYRALVEQVAAAERKVDPQGSELATAVARNYFKLLAYKDEYEVARMHASAEFRAQLLSSFEGPVRLSFHLAPPLFARRDPRTGIPRKVRVGPWMMGAFKLLARLKFLRGTALDPFGFTTERRTERACIQQYEAQVRKILDGLSASRLATAIELAKIPDRIRGFGHVKQRNQQLAASAESTLWERWQSESAAS